MDKRYIIFVGGPYDGGVESLFPYRDGECVCLCHLTSQAFHSYRSVNPLAAYGYDDEIVVCHDPTRTHLREDVKR